MSNETTVKYDIPLSHLDYGYIKECSDVKELEKILKILRTGEEGRYPQMEEMAEQRIQQLNPNSRVLRKENPIQSSKDLGTADWEALNSDLQQWSTDMKSMENGLTKTSISDSLSNGSVPPIRGCGQSLNTSKSAESKQEEKKSQRNPKPREYRDWDKIDIDSELAKVDEKNPKSQSKTTKSKPVLPSTVDSSNLTDHEKALKAEREKDKGNEAFRAGDYEEALVYYQRSLSIIPTVAATNNRAQIYLKMKRWHSAIEDCNTVLKAEPRNVKAFLRRATAYQGQKEFTKAQEDLKKVLSLEPSNKRGLTLLQEVEKTLAEQKVKGRRMVIQEVEGSDSSGEESDDEEVKPESSADNDKKIQQKNEENLLRNATSESPSNAHPSDDTQKEETNASKEEVVQEAVNPPPPVVNSSPDTPPPLSPEARTMKDRGNELFRNGQYSEALEAYNKAITLVLPELNTQAANLSVLYSNRAACKNKVGDCAGCVEDCDKSLNLTPGASKPLLRRAVAYEAMEKYQQAYVDYRQVLNIDPCVDVAQQGATRCSQVLKEQDGPKWRDKLPPVPTVYPGGLSYPAPVLTPAQAAAKRNREREEAEKQRREQERLEQCFEKMKAEGNAHVQKGNFQKAIDCYSECVNCCPEKAVAYTNRALCYLRLKQPDTVVDDCNKALSLDFENVKALFRRAQAYKMQGKHEESAIDLQTLLKIDPSNAAAKKELELVEKDVHEKELQRQAEMAKWLAEEESKQRHRMHIQEVEGSSDEDDVPHPEVNGTSQRCLHKSKEAKGKHKTCKAAEDKEPVVPTLQKATPYEFVHAWTSLKACNKVEPYLSLILQVPPKDFPKVISNKLEGDMLLNIIKAMEILHQKRESKLVFDYLSNLSQVPRFQMVSMFMSSTEKLILGKIFRSLAQQADAVGITLTDIAKTQRTYGL